MLERGELTPRKHWTNTAVLLYLCFIVGSILFLVQMGRQYTEENLQYLDNAARQHETALVKQIEGDFQTLHGVAVFVAEQDITELEELVRLVGEVNEGNVFIRMGFATLEGRLELMELGGKRYQNLDVSGEKFFQRAAAGEDVIANAAFDSFSEEDAVYYYAVPVRNGEGSVIGVLCAVNDVSVLREILEAPLLSGTGFTGLYDSTGRGIFCSSCPEFGAQGADDLGSLSGVSREDEEAVQRALSDGGRTHFRYRTDGTAMLAVLEPMGVEDWFVMGSVSVQALRQRYFATVAGAIVIIAGAYILFLFLLFQQRRIMTRNQEVVERLAYVDELTGGKNYNKFLLDAEAALKAGGQQAIWYCDLKRFKYYNEALGYQMGDEMLRKMFGLFSEMKHPDGVFCRASADNFIGLRPYRRQKDLVDWYEELTEKLHQLQQESANQFYMELCVGFYCLEPQDSGLTLNEMVNRANMAQKSVKGNYGSGYAFFTQALRQSNLQISSLEAEGKQALEAGQFQPYFQPKFNIQSGDRLTGAEVLCRWFHPEKGMIPPDQFIPVFEKSGLIVQLDRCMFRQACQWYRRYLDRGGRQLNLAVNVSRVGLLRKDFVDYYAGVKAEFGLPDGTIELEVTESLALGGEDFLAQLVRELQQKGFICSLDDFGSGYSSLNLLKNLPINVLKLDILFFQKSVDQARERVVVRNIINMAKELQIRVIAEGVENRESVDFLREAGCDTVQGYVFAKPMPLQEFEAALQKGGQLPEGPGA